MPGEVSGVSAPIALSVPEELVEQIAARAAEIVLERQREEPSSRWLYGAKAAAAVRKQLDRSGDRVRPKTDRAIREIELMPALVRTLTTHKEDQFALGHARTDNFVFCTATGTPLHYRNVVRRGLDVAVERAGLSNEPRLRFHDLRHTFASLLIAEGLDVVFVSRQLGHASTSVSTSTPISSIASRTGAALARRWKARLERSWKAARGIRGKARQWAVAETSSISRETGLAGIYGNSRAAALIRRRSVVRIHDRPLRAEVRLRLRRSHDDFRAFDFFGERELTGPGKARPRPARGQWTICVFCT
jgi:hypothetical protein